MVKSIAKQTGRLRHNHENGETCNYCPKNILSPSCSFRFLDDSVAYFTALYLEMSVKFDGIRLLNITIRPWDHDELNRDETQEALDCGAR